MRVLVVLAALLALLGPRIAYAQAQPTQSLEGWEVVRSTIASQPASKMSALNGRVFHLKLSTDSYDLQITPDTPFKLTGSGNEFDLTIVDALSLIENRNGLVIKKPIGWTAKYGDSAKFSLAIEGIDECIFNLTFKQTDGDILDLEKLQANYDVAWSFDNPGAIATQEINGSSLKVRRVAGDTSDVSVTLTLTSKVGGFTVASKPVSIQKCARDFKDPRGNQGILQIRVPAQCINRIDSREVEYSTGNGKGMNYYESYGNNCDRSVKCVLYWSMWGYHSIDDQEKNINGTKLSWWTRTINFSPYEKIKNDFHMESPEYYKLYLWTNTWLPDGAVNGYSSSDFQCSWAS